MLFSNKNFLVLAVALLALAITAGAVFIHKSNSAPAGPYAQDFQSRQNSPQPLYPESSTPSRLANVPAESGSVREAGYQSDVALSGADPCGTNSRGYISRPTYDDDRYYSRVRRPVYVHQTVYHPVQKSFVADRGSTSERVYRNEVRQGRSKKKSAIIVAGTAGVGAAIGAVAAGGKGAALGGLSGGAAGFLYDRLTHNH